MGKGKSFPLKGKSEKQKRTHRSFLPGTKSRTTYLPAVVAEGRVLVAKMGATVAAATGVPVLKMVFCEGTPGHSYTQEHFTLPGSLTSRRDSSLSASIPRQFFTLILPEPLYGAAVSVSLMQDEKVV